MNCENFLAHTETLTQVLTEVRTTLQLRNSNMPSVIGLIDGILFLSQSAKTGLLDIKEGKCEGWLDKILTRFNDVDLFLANAARDLNAIVPYFAKQEGMRNFDVSGNIIKANDIIMKLRFYAINIRTQYLQPVIQYESAPVPDTQKEDIAAVLSDIKQRLDRLEQRSR